jgi:hypothetical protein
MRRPGAGSDRLTVARPVGVSAGTLGFALAWIGGAAIVQLTGATPVMIILVVGAVAALLAALAGCRDLVGVVVGRPTLPPVVTLGDEFGLTVPISSRRPVWAEVELESPTGCEIVAGGWTDGSSLRTSGHIAVRGRADVVRVRVRASGGPGLVWWVRVCDREIEPVHVGAAIIDGRADVSRAALADGDELAGAAGAVAGQIDGVRPWREGDSDKYVHWSTTLRTGELVVHDRRREMTERLVVRARRNRPDSDVEAGIVRGALEAGLRSGSEVSVALEQGEPELIRSSIDAARWTAAADLGPPPDARRRRWWRRGPVEPETVSTVRARWWAAAATLVSLLMLAGVVGTGPLLYIGIVIGVAAGAQVSARSLATGTPMSATMRGLTAAASLLAVVVVAASSGRFDGLLAFLSGPLPQILVVLVVLHGFECRDRRSVRVSLAVSALVVMYASAFRVDDRLIWCGFASPPSGPTPRFDRGICRVHRGGGRGGTGGRSARGHPGTERTGGVVAAVADQGRSRDTAARCHRRRRR